MDNEDLEFTDGEEPQEGSPQKPQGIFGGIASLTEMFSQEEASRAEGRKKAIQEFLCLDFSQVVRVENIIRRWLSLGKECAKHDLFCQSPKCTTHPTDGGVLAWCDWATFLNCIAMQVEHEEEEITQLLPAWKSKPVKEVEEDPRFIAFRAGYDSFLVKQAARREKLCRVPRLKEE